MEQLKIFDEISRDAYDSSIWIYVKIQTHMENLLKQVLRNSGNRVPDNVKSCIDEVGQLFPQRDFELFYELNRKANNVKHQNALDEEYDREFLYDFSNVFNKFVKVSKLNVTKFLIDEHLFEKPLTVERSNLKSVDIEPKIIRKKIDENVIFIPCGIGGTDSQFEIHISNRESILNNFERSVYATIFNFLQRSDCAEKPSYLRAREATDGVVYDYSTIFRCEMLLLALIWRGYVEEGFLSLSVAPQYKEKFDLAGQCISHYAQMLASLCNRTIQNIGIRFVEQGTCIRFNEEADVWLENVSSTSKARKYWYSENLQYSAKADKHGEILKELLQDFFGYEDFRPGQLNAIIATLNTKERSICIMPTGAGKSLIFYMNALLSPCPSIVISPTRILARDQKRNLKEIHNIDDCAVYGENGEKGLQLDHKLIYMTPEDLQSYYLITDVIKFNVKYEISNVFLDEVHTLCNWSHDFRPDYLMLCTNLFNFVDHCRYLGFTATANYKVISDLVRQLKISYKEVIQPLVFNAGDFEFEYISCENEHQELLILINKFNEFISNRESPNDRMIVFTHNYAESKKLSDRLAELANYEASCFDAEHTYSYLEFLEGNKHILIADSEMGIGINLPGVTTVIHFGLPPSKAQYVQEIGRANRNLNHGKSIVIFQDERYLTATEKELIRFDTTTDDIVRLLTSLDSNIAKLFKTILGSTEGYVGAATNIRRIYTELDKVSNYTIEEFDVKDRKRFQKYFYKLHLLGIIDNWYVKTESEKSIVIQIEVDFQKGKIESVKERILRYLSMMGAGGIYAYNIQNDDSIEDIICDFEKWFYDEFLRYHREQLLNVLSFFNYYAQKEDRRAILKDLENYFATAFESMDDGKNYISKISVDELLSNENALDSNINGIAEQLLMNSYDYKSDLICFLYQQRRNDDIVSASRLIRIIDNSGDVDRRIILDNVNKFYNRLKDEDRLDLINALFNYYPEEFVINSIYTKTAFDLIYFGYVAYNINSIIGGKNV